MAPIELVHETTNMIRMVPHFELLVDERGDAFSRPEVGAITVSQRSSEKQLQETLLLSRLELRGSPRRESDLERWRSPLLASITPTHNRTRGAADAMGDFVQRQALVEQFQSTVAAIFKKLGGSSRTHGEPSLHGGRFYCIIYADVNNSLLS